MADISNIDKNFAVETKLDKNDIRFYDIDTEPFAVYGLSREDGKYIRLPGSVSETVSPGVHMLHTNTAGGRVRFVTDSSYVTINAVMDGIGKMPHFPFTGSAGFDLYADNVYINTFVPPLTVDEGYESVIEFGSAAKREITINFPLYSNVQKLYIGLSDTSFVGKASPYKNSKPVVYYGSSITQGGCASRPGNSYQAIVSRFFNLDYVNLGFSGNAKAEGEMIEYIKDLDMSVFVYDYDHNAPTVEHLRNTHEKMFKAIREKNPTLPVIMMTRPKAILTDEEQIRRSIVETTYKNALASGDKNVYFIDNEMLTALCGNEGTVDNCHPNDFGFASMARAVIDVMKKIEF